VLVACAPPGAEVEDEEVDDTEQDLGVRPGDTVTRNGVTAVAPLVEGGVFAEVLFESGESRTLHLRTGPDARVFLVDDAHEDPGEIVETANEAAGEVTSSSGPGPCKDSAKNLLPYKVAGTLEWRFNAGSAPASTSVDNVEAALKKAAGNITQSRNSCGMADQVGAKHHYAGRTTAGAQITSSGACQGTGNGINTVGFGDLPAGVLGLACVFYDGNKNVIEADIRLNKADHAWYAVKPASCSGRFSVEAVATHEFGHVFGLGHVGEGAHGNLTMSPAINGPCQGSEATLGRGDVLGLRAKY
jgi:hypothetical protein